MQIKIIMMWNILSDYSLYDIAFEWESRTDNYLAKMPYKRLIIVANKAHTTVL